MSDLIPKNTDEEMERYNEADMIRRARIPMEGNQALKFEHDPVTKRENALFPLSSGGYVKIGDRAVTPEQAAETDVLAARRVVQDLGNTPIGQFFNEAGPGGPSAEDYDAAGFTEAEVLDFEARRSAAVAGEAAVRDVEPGFGAATPLTEEQMQFGEEVGAPKLTEAETSLRDRVRDIVYTGLDQFVDDPNDLRFWSNYLTDVVDVTAPGVGGAMSVDEGFRIARQGYQTGNAVDMLIGGVLSVMGVTELVPIVKGLTRPARQALAENLSPEARNLLADAIGTTRAVVQRDREMLMEIFQPAGTPRSLGAAGTGMDNVPPGATTSLRADGPQNEEARQAIVSIAAQRNPERPRVKIEDIASYHEQNHLAQYGRQLDPYNDQDFELAVDAATNEVRYQLDQAVSGQGWYDSDVRKTFEIASQIPGLESLATSETDRVIMSAIMAPTSIGQLVTNNTRAAIAAMLQYKRTGQIPTTPPAKGAMTEGIQNAGWGLKQGSVAANMRVISHLVDTLGPDGFADWWLSPHSLRELTEVRKAAGLSAGPSGLSGGQDSMHLGAMVIGDKTGRFSLNINGYEGTTKDVWFTRSYNRLFGNMRDNIGEVAGGPRNATERRRMEDFVRTMRDRLEDQGLSEQDIQAVMWYYEQNLMTDLGVQSRPGAFSEEAERIYGQLRPGVRGSDATEAAAEPGSLTGFRGVSPTQRTVRAERRLPQRVDPRDPTGQAGPYTRGAGSGDAGDGLLVLEPNAQSQARYQEAGLSLPTVREVPAAQSAAQYNADMTGAMAGHRFGAQVEIKSPEELADARLFRTDDGSGFAIKPDGDIVAVFAGQSAARGSGYSMLQAAVAAGGRKLDAFDTYLPKIYETAGFRPVARLPWNDEFAPPNWDKETFSNFNNGEPDVVFFVYDPDYYGGAVDVPVFNDYGDAVAEQDRQLQALGGSQ
jgi:hypothetical protein